MIIHYPEIIVIDILGYTLPFFYIYIYLKLGCVIYFVVQSFFFLLKIHFENFSMQLNTLLKHSFFFFKGMQCSPVHIFSTIFYDGIKTEF